MLFRSDLDWKTGELLFCLQMVDKRGKPKVGSLARLMLLVSQHAVESLYQRLKTTEWKELKSELDPVGNWFFDNADIVAMEGDGYLVTPSGVFPVVHGRPIRSDSFTAFPYWVATTWIAKDHLEDHTPHKKRVAEAVRAVTGGGVQFVRL